MKIEKLNVGCKIGTEKYAVECKVQVAETVADCEKLAKSEAFVCQMFNRGWRIWCQEQSGARDVVENATAEQRKERVALTTQVQSVIDAADPSAPAKRSGRPSAPVNVTVTTEMEKAMKKGDLAALQAMLAAAGVKANFSK